MLPILTFLGLAFAASLWPESTAEGADGPKTAGDDLSASGTSNGETGDTPLNYVDPNAQNAVETLSSSGQAAGDPADELMSGTDAIDMMFGEDGGDTMSGGAGADYLDGGEGDDALFGDDDAEGDEMIGGEGHDRLWLGGGDTATGGRGDDMFNMQADIEEASIISDYNPDDDTVAVYYDPAGPVPQLKTEQAEDGTRLYADDQVLAVFTGPSEVALADIKLVPEATAA